MMGRAMDEKQCAQAVKKEGDYCIIKYEGGADTGGTFDILIEGLAKRYWLD